MFCRAFAALFLASCPLAGTAAEIPISRITLGSCVRENRAQPIWEAVIDSRPQLFLFIGDNIYADTDRLAVMKQKYGVLGGQPDFKRLRQICPILATWDDHDYGRNNAGREYPLKAKSQEVFLDFFREPPDSPRRKRQGVYMARSFGPVGRRLQVILLDTRYHRSPLHAAHARKDSWGMPRAPYAPHPDPRATILGKDQWQWLAKVLREPAEIRIIVSSIQLIPAEHAHEKWANFPRERDRFFQLIASTRASGVIVVSGDRHLAEISRSAEGPYPLLELTSSGLNAGGGGRDDEPNRYRLGRNYRGTNFGTIEVDWARPDPRITLRAHDGKGKPVLQHQVNLGHLQPADASTQLESR